MNEPHSMIVVAGPTASGKSDFAVNLALEHNGEIISADSRQIYRGLNLGTGKIMKEEMKGVPHYMIDICDISESFSVAKFKEQAEVIIKDIISRGKTPIICGGTGQYIDALIFDAELPHVEPNEPLRANLETKSTEELYTELLKKDTRRAESIDKHNRVRLIRALEIIDSVGKVPIQKEESLRENVTMYLITPSKEILKERIEKRLLKRLEVGMIGEMESLIAQGYEIEVLAQKGIEYKYMAKYLKKEITYDELIEQLKFKIWQYAKRQRTWNKKYAFAELAPVK